MDRLVSVPRRDSSRFDGDKTAYASKSRRICFNPCKGFSSLLAKYSKSPPYFSLPVAIQF